MIPGFYNHNYQILQTPDYVVILVEMIHDARIIPLDDRPHLPPQIRHWLGDSRGHWEGDTLVVETSHFSARGDQRVRNLVLAGSEHSHLVERFRRVDADTIEYRFTVTDPRSIVRVGPACERASEMILATIFGHPQAEVGRGAG